MRQTETLDSDVSANVVVSQGRMQVAFRLVHLIEGGAVPNASKKSSWRS